MCEYINFAKDFLEKAINIVECNDEFNNGQSKKVNDMYDALCKVNDDLSDIAK